MTTATELRQSASKKSMMLSREAIDQINSLGGPPLPVGVSTTRLKVILENRRASDSPFREVSIPGISALSSTFTLAD
jgi:hypothetical protein